MNVTDATDRTETMSRRVGPQGRPYGSLVAGAILIVLGVLWLLDVSDVLELRLNIVLPAILIVIGLALVVGARNGPHSGLVVWGLLISLVVVASATIPLTAFSGGVGERDILVTDQARLESTYSVGVGDLRLDLSDLTLTESAVVEVSVGAGELTVALPADVPVDIEASTGAGEIILLGDTRDGIGVRHSYRSEGFATAPVTLSLDLRTAAGKIEVSR